MTKPPDAKNLEIIRMVGEGMTVKEMTDYFPDLKSTRAVYARMLKMADPEVAYLVQPTGDRVGKARSWRVSEKGRNLLKRWRIKGAITEPVA